MQYSYIQLIEIYLQQFKMKNIILFFRHLRLLNFNIAYDNPIGQQLAKNGVECP